MSRGTARAQCDRRACPIWMSTMSATKSCRFWPRSAFDASHVIVEQSRESFSAVDRCAAVAEGDARGERRAHSRRIGMPTEGTAFSSEGRAKAASE
eukprot:3808762-Prymnesium_polylepis.1